MPNIYCDFCSKECDEDRATSVTDYVGTNMEMDMVTRFMCDKCCDSYAQALGGKNES